jgi:hypothetical protein
VTAVTLLHLPLEIDGEVYPELYAMLVGLRSDAARVERLRQLAATGLVWETVRQSGYPKTLEPSPAPPRAAESFIDLAIDAPKPAPPDLAHEVEIAVRELPVLHDVIDMEPPLEPDPEPPPPHEPGGDVIHMPPIASRPETRSRLQRMKEKGLFKNG